MNRNKFKQKYLPTSISQSNQSSIIDESRVKEKQPKHSTLIAGQPTQIVYPSAPTHEWHHNFPTEQHSLEKNLPPTFYQQAYVPFSDHLLRAAQSVNNISETTNQPNRKKNRNKSLASSSASLTGEKKGAGRAQGRTFAEKKSSDRRCPKCGKWFTIGMSLNAHKLHNANKAKCD